VSRCIPTDAAAITLGVDTHKDIHVGVALDGVGRRQGTLSVPANSAGYGRLVEWASGFGPLAHAGVEGTGSFGAGLASFLKARGIKVSEVIRPKNAATSTAPASPTPSTPRRRPAPCLPPPPPASPRTPTAR
jgi:transposase